MDAVPEPEVLNDLAMYVEPVALLEPGRRDWRSR